MNAGNLLPFLYCALIVDSSVPKNEFNETTEFMTTLVNRMTDVYNQLVGVNYTRQVAPYSLIYFDYQINDLNDFDEVNGKLQTIGDMYVTWHDVRLEWNEVRLPRTNGGEVVINHTFIPIKELWHPEILLFNPVWRMILFDKDRKTISAHVNNTGWVKIILSDLLTTSCHPNVKWFPFDSHHCVLDFTSSSSLNRTQYFVREGDGIFRDNTKRRRLESQLNALTNQKSNMEDANEFAGYVSKFATPPECLDFKDMVKRRLRRLTEMPCDVAPHDNALIRFQKHRLENAFQEFVHSCGDVWYTSTYVPKTKIVTHDLNIHEKDVAMTITLFNQEGDIQKQGAVDVEAEVLHPDGTKSQPPVEDATGTDGCYKLHFVGNQLGCYHGYIYVLEQVVNPDGFSFHIVSGRADTLTTYDNKRMQSASTSTTGGGNPSEALGVDPVLGDVVCPEFMFDASISHASVEICDDAKYMKAKHIKRAHAGSYRSKESGRLVNYRGTMANVPLYKTGLYYFEISIQYKVLRLIRQTMVFEVGLARLDVIDKHYSVDCYPYAWAVSARGCHVCGKVCLQTWHNGQLLSHSALSPRTPNPPGTVVRTHYGFLLDTTKRHWIVVDVKSNKLVFHFKNLVVSELSDPLWPIFGIYNPDYVSVTFQLITGSDIKSIPEAAIDAVTI